MSDFDQVVKPLDIVFVEETVPAGAKSPRPVKVRRIEKLLGKVKFPARSIVSDVIPDTGVPWIIFQYDLTLPQDFSVYNFKDLFGNAFNYFYFTGAAIRYREGEDVTRYFLGGIPYEEGTENPWYPSNLRGDEGFNYVPAPIYGGQVIKKNCVLEIWRYKTTGDTVVGHNYFELITTLPYNPSNANETEREVDVARYVRDELFVAVPEVIPTPYDVAGQWLDNV